MMSSAFAWKLVLALALGGVIFASARAPAPQRAFPRGDLRRLVLSAVLLYAIGLVASLSHHGMLAAIVYVGGISVSALAAWLSRGAEPGSPPGDDEPGDPQPSPDPDGAPRFDWSSFERDFRIYDRRASRPRAPVG